MHHPPEKNLPHHHREVDTNHRQSAAHPPDADLLPVTDHHLGGALLDTHHPGTGDLHLGTEGQGHGLLGEISLTLQQNYRKKKNASREKGTVYQRNVIGQGHVIDILERDIGQGLVIGLGQVNIGQDQGTDIVHVLRTDQGPVNIGPDLGPEKRGNIRNDHIAKTDDCLFTLATVASSC